MPSLPFVREERPEDAAAIRSLLIAAFGGTAEADLVEALRASGDAEIALIAEDGGTIIGQALLSPMQAPFPALALAPVAVLPEHQLTRIGTRIVEAALALARDSSWEAVFVLGDPAYYGRFGFDTALATGFSSPYAGSHFMALALNGELPTMSGELRHAPAFSELA